MGDMKFEFDDLKYFQRQVRRTHAVEYPKRAATKLLPQQRCRVCGHIDGRPELTDEDYAKIGNEDAA